jgi:hypothetical protein
MDGFFKNGKTVNIDSWFGFDHSAVKARFGGDPSFVAEFEIDGKPWAVYHCPNPDRSKGHKDFLMLTLITDLNGSRRAVVSGRDFSEMEKHRFQTGVLCKSCGSILYSRANHDYRICPCDNMSMVDGGRSYIRYGGQDLSLVEMIEVDHFAFSQVPIQTTPLT